LERILESLTNDGVTPADAAVGQFFWVTLHEVGQHMEVVDAKVVCQLNAIYLLERKRPLVEHP
jgi:hypothetical protein